MKSPQAERNADLGRNGLAEGDEHQDEAHGDSESSPQIPFPTISETLDIDQATRIFLSFVAELNEGWLTRPSKGNG
jgi:hypothetical protein